MFLTLARVPKSDKVWFGILAQVTPPSFPNESVGNLLREISLTNQVDSGQSLAGTTDGDKLFILPVIPSPP